MKPATVFRGDTWLRSWLLKAGGVPLDLSGATARLHLRDEAGALVVAATTADGRLTVTPLSGRIDLLVPAATMVITPGRYRFDLEVTFNDGRRQTVEQTTLVVLEDMSRD